MAAPTSIADYWAQKQAALNPTGAKQLNYNVGQLPAGWWNGSGNQMTGGGTAGTFGGPIPVGNLTSNDAAFLEAATRVMGGGFDPRNIASGDKGAVDALLGGDTTAGINAAQNNTSNFLHNVSPAVLQAMQQMASQNPEMAARYQGFLGQNNGTNSGANPGQGAGHLQAIANSYDKPSAPQTQFSNEQGMYWNGQQQPGAQQGATPATLGDLASGNAGNAGSVSMPAGGNQGSASTGGTTSGGTATGNPMDSFLNPAIDYMNQMGLKDLQSSYAGAGNFLSGPAMRGITDYGQKMALGQAWQPAFADYMANQQQQHQFAQEDQTIPFQQQMQLAQLGMQGTQGAGNLSSILSSILSGNLSNLGQVQGTGTIGTSNSITNALSQWLAQMMSQNTLNQVLQKP